jgi:hypothetical protein
MSKPSGLEVPSKDLVRKLRPAFLGIPDDSPFDTHLLIWSHDNALRAAFVSDIPETLSYRRSNYHLQQPYVGDWDALLDSAGRLVGVSMFVSHDQPILNSDFLWRHKQFILNYGMMLEILLSPDTEYKVRCIQGVGTRFYSDSHGDYMFLFPQWCHWGEIAFPLTTAEIPDLG